MNERMQSCYVNTTHPDFLGGHKVRQSGLHIGDRKSINQLCMAGDVNSE